MQVISDLLWTAAPRRAVVNTQHFTNLPHFMGECDVNIPENVKLFLRPRLQSHHHALIKSAQSQRQKSNAHSGFSYSTETFFSGKFEAVRRDKNESDDKREIGQCRLSRRGWG